MVLPGFGWLTFHVQGCDSARHTQRLILTHLPSCFQLLKHLGLSQGGRAGVPSQVPSHTPDWTAGHPRHLSPWPHWDVGGRELWTGPWGDLSPWTQFFILKTAWSYVSWFFYQRSPEYGEAPGFWFNFGCKKQPFFHYCFFHPYNNLFSISVNPFTDILFIGYFRWFVEG